MQQRDSGPKSVDKVSGFRARLHIARGAERPQVSDQSAVARREESCSGAARSGVRRGAAVPRRTEPKRVSAASAERTGFDRYSFHCFYQYVLQTPTTSLALSCLSHFILESPQGRLQLSLYFYQRRLPVNKLLLLLQHVTPCEPCE